MNSYVIGQLADIRRDELIAEAANERRAARAAASDGTGATTPSRQRRPTLAVSSHRGDGSPSSNVQHTMNGVRQRPHREAIADRFDAEAHALQALLAGGVDRASHAHRIDLDRRPAGERADLRTPPARGGDLQRPDRQTRPHRPALSAARPRPLVRRRPGRSRARESALRRLPGDAGVPDRRRPPAGAGRRVGRPDLRRRPDRDPKAIARTPPKGQPRAVAGYHEGRPPDLTRVERDEVLRWLTDLGKSARDTAEQLGTTERTVSRRRAALHVAAVTCPAPHTATRRSTSPTEERHSRPLAAGSRWRRPARVTAWLAAIALTGYGGLLTAAGLLVQAGLVPDCATFARLSPDLGTAPRRGVVAIKAARNLTVGRGDCAHSTRCPMPGYSTVRAAASNTSSPSKSNAGDRYQYRCDPPPPNRQLSCSRRITDKSNARTYTSGAVARWPTRRPSRWTGRVFVQAEDSRSTSKQPSSSGRCSPSTCLPSVFDRAQVDLA